MRQSFLNLVAILLVAFALTGCKTSTERAEDHYIDGRALYEEGQPRRAIVELRNAVRLNVYHQEARLLLADILVEQNLTGEAFREYRTLIEQNPENLPALRGVATLSLRQGEFVRAQQAAEQGLALMPGDTELEIISVAVEYRNSLIGEQDDIRRDTARRADALRSRSPDSRLLYGIVIDSYVRDGEDLAALAEIDSALEFDPQNLLLYQVQLEILLRRGDYPAVEQSLRRMLIRFPENVTVKESLIRYYISRGQLDEAESFLREQIEPNVKGDAARVSLVRFLAEGRSRDLARAELEGFISEGTNNTLFRSIRATMNYEDGFRQQAIAEMEDIVASTEPSEERREVQVLLARMLEETGNEVGARAMIEGVLESDPTSVEALKVRATWRIDNDETDAAIIDLRTALDQEPNDASVMTLMARAHLLNGERDLAGEMLALAVQASQSGEDESLRYARFLIADGKYLPAESIIVDALRINRGSLPLLTEAARLYVTIEDWPRAEQVERELRGLERPEANAVANDVRYALLNAQNRSAELNQFLEELTTGAQTNIAAEVAILQSHIERGDRQLARGYLDTLIAQRPDDDLLVFLDGALSATEGDYPRALEIFDALLAKDDSAARIWIEKARALNAMGRTDEAKATIDAALDVADDRNTLYWMKASIYEQEGDFEGALGIYELLYDADNSTSVIANNLASLLSTLRDDAESLDRAYQIARRLRDSDFAPFQDTYGWIVFRRGDYEEALRHLEPAARQLRTDPLVQYHLARVYQAMGQTDRALAQYRTALELAEDDPRPQFDRARQEVQALSGQ